MTETSIQDQLRTLLEAERQALMAGDFDKIADLMDEKQKIVGTLSEETVTDDQLAPLRDGLRRNQELFDQALAGLRNVATRLGDLNRLRRSMDTYDKDGRRMTIDAPQENKLERRA